jgi:hypothetical protein
MIGIKKFLGKSKAHLIALNEKAFDAGAKLVR